MLALPIVGGISAVARIPPQIVLPALTLAVSIWFLIFGLLGLGFIFDLIPVFVCLALVTALSIITIVLQIPTFLGLLGIPPIFMAVIPASIQSIRNTNGRTLAVSISAIVFLGTLLFFKTKWGKERTARGRISRAGTAVGGLIVVVVFAGVSSIFLRDVPIQLQVAPFIPPLPPGGGFPPGGPTAGAPPPGGFPAGFPGASPQAALTNSSSGVAMINPMLLGAARRNARRQIPGAQVPPGAAGAVPPPPSAPGQGIPPPGVLPGNISAVGLPGGLPPLPKLPFWAAFPEFQTEIPGARVPIIRLAQALFLPSFLVFFSINIEHIVVARFFAHEHGYSVSKSQEMFSLGLINAVNSMFGGVPVGGGDMARSSVLGFAGANSPLNQVFASAAVLVCMAPASAALRFLPQAALSAIIVVAIFEQMPPQKLLNVYFKLSFVDFLVFFLVLNVGIAAPGPINTIAAVGLGVIFMILYTLFRIMFKKPKVITDSDLEMLSNPKSDEGLRDGEVIPASTLVIKVDGDMIFTNAERMRRRIVDAAYFGNSGRAMESLDEPERAWNVVIDRYVNSVRRRKGSLNSASRFRPRLRMVILDMTTTTFMDTSALMSLELMKKQLRDWAGDTVEFRFVGMNKHLKRRLERAKWQIVDPYGPRVVMEDGDEDEVRDMMFDSLPQALHFVSQDVAINGTFEEIMVMGVLTTGKPNISGPLNLF